MGCHHPAISEHHLITGNVSRLAAHCRRHAEEQNTAQHKLLIIILTLLSATGALIVFTVQSLVTIAK